jgi:hypothetical protein
LPKTQNQNKTKQLENGWEMRLLQLPQFIDMQRISFIDMQRISFIEISSGFFLTVNIFEEI